jgi:hypothetical protein
VVLIALSVSLFQLWLLGRRQPLEPVRLRFASAATAGSAAGAKTTCSTAATGGIFSRA